MYICKTVIGISCGYCHCDNMGVLPIARLGISKSRIIAPKARIFIIQKRRGFSFFFLSFFFLFFLLQKSIFTCTSSVSQMLVTIW